jgi:CBS domain-containing protein
MGNVYGMYKPIEVSPDLTVRDAAQIMVTRGIHHLVVTEKNSVKGFVSSLDLIKEYLLKEGT